MLGIDLRLSHGLEWAVSLIARISFSAYLVNLPVMILMKQFIRTDGSYRVGLLLLFHLATFSLACLLYWNYELLFYRYRDRYVPDEGRTGNPYLRRGA